MAKLKGDTVFSGTINLWGAVKLKATKPAGASALQKVIRLIQESQHLKSTEPAIH